MTTELRKVLQATTGSGQYLVAEDLEPLIRQTLLNLSPLTSMVPMVSADGHIHKITRRTALPRGRFEGENPSPTYTQSTYDRRQVQVKILRVHGQVTDFLVSAARSYADVLEEELMATIEGFADVLEFATIWGCSDELSFTGDAIQYPGWYAWLLNDASSTNVIDVDGTIALTNLDSALATSKLKYRQTLNDDYVWLMSQDMIDKVSGLQTRIQREVPRVEYEGGFVMTTYKGIPILPSSFMAPASTTTSPAVSATGGTSGTLDDDTYYYKIASITRYGEQEAGTVSSGVTLSGGGNGSVDLSWTADSNAELYAIYRSDATNNNDDDFDLVDIIAAKTYTNGAPTGTATTYTDDGSQTALTTVHPLGSGEETIALVNLNPERGMSRVVLNPELGDPVEAFLSYVPVVENTDTHQWRLKSYHAIQVPWGAAHAVIRRATPT